jgi:hypothetical protein
MLLKKQRTMNTFKKKDHFGDGFSVSFFEGISKKLTSKKTCMSGKCTFHVLLSGKRTHREYQTPKIHLQRSTQYFVWKISHTPSFLVDRKPKKSRKTCEIGNNGKSAAQNPLFF